MELNNLVKVEFSTFFFCNYNSKLFCPSEIFTAEGAEFYAESKRKLIVKV